MKCRMCIKLEDYFTVMCWNDDVNFLNFILKIDQANDKW